VADQNDSQPGVAAESGRLVADALESALLRLAEALRGEQAAAAAPGAGAAPAASPADAEGDAGVVQSLTSWPVRTMTDAASTIAASVVPAVVERIDVNALLAKVDVDALVARIDVNRVLDSVEPNRLLEKVDVDELVNRVDVGAVAREALEGVDVGELIQDSTASIASEAVELGRIQAMRADDLVARIVDRCLFRRRPRDTALTAPAPR
jgi:hypothetical protein